MTIKKPTIIFHCVTTVSLRLTPDCCYWSTVKMCRHWMPQSNRRNHFEYEVMVSMLEGCVARAEGWVNIATCSTYRWRGDLRLTFLPTLLPKVWQFALVIHMEAGGRGAKSGREGVSVGSRSWILGWLNIRISHSREWCLNAVFMV